DALTLYEKGSWNSCLNRLYYAAFYAAISVMLERQIRIKSHNGVKQKLGEIYLQGEIDKKLVKTFNLLADFRHKGDYDDLFDFNEELVKPLIEPVKEFIDKMEALVKIDNL
ncbi:MAG: HEPN domain-containing protein, partial [Bacteroidota bacterium]|nr:HEPN domain-containing protein [Bacteroidota bacterium]